MFRPLTSRAAWSARVASLCILVLASAAHAITAKHVAVFKTTGSPPCICSAPMGTAVSAGDFNGDGAPDIAIGEQFVGTGGRVRLLFGGVNPDTTADLVLTGPVASGSFGASVACAGDVNGDGYDDLIVGAPATYITTSPGNAYVYFGGATPNNVADVTMTGSVNQDGFGTHVAGGVDVNGDGFDDWAVASPFNDDNGAGTGRVDVFFGGATPNGSRDGFMLGAATNTMLGDGLFAAHDLDRDGFEEFVCVGLNADAFGNYCEFYGATMPPGSFRYPAVAAGDVTGDGIDDLILCEQSFDAPGSLNVGRLHVLPGGAEIDTTTVFAVTGTAVSGFMGQRAGIADVTGDGIGDILASVYQTSTVSSVVAVCEGGESPAATPSAFFAIDGGSFFLTSIQSVGDWNGDGMPDVLVSAAGSSSDYHELFSVFVHGLHEPAGSTAWIAGGLAQLAWSGRDRADLQLSTDGGATWATVVPNVGGELENVVSFTVPEWIGAAVRARLLRRDAPAGVVGATAWKTPFRIVAPVEPGATLSRTRFTLNGSTTGEAFGTSVAGAGDVNGDGFPDFIAGAPLATAGAGRAAIFFGGPSEDGVADVTLTGSGNENLGTAVAAAGDVNGDGFDDVIIGAPFNDTGFTDAGRAYVYFGGSPMNATADMTLTGVETTEELGLTVAGLGDFNQDGFDDVAVGAPLSNAGGTDIGRVYVYYGGATPNSSVDLTFSGTVNGENFGDAVAGGDLDGDRVPELVVGSPDYPIAGAAAGRVSVFHGGTVPNTAVDVVWNGFGTGLMGFALSLGDITGDGLADLLVGSPTTDLGATNTGSARAYFGGAAFDSVPDFTWQGELASDQFGWAVSACGDLDGDRIGDVAIGVPFADPLGANGAGRVQVFRGGTFSATPFASFAGSASFDNFGRALAGLGDLTGDGFADLALAAPGADVPAVDAGRILVIDRKRYVVQSPNGGETWNVGAQHTVKWLGSELADVWLSDDGGTSWTQVAARVGGDAVNQVRVRVPHQPTRFALVKLTPANAAVAGIDVSDSLFTVQASIALLGLSVAQAPSGSGVEVSWNTNPGPADLAGYTLERAAETTGDAPSRGDEIDATRWIIVAERTTATHVVDVDGTTASRYRLTAINGLGEALVLGETTAAPLTPLSAGPLPYRGGELTVHFASVGDIGGTAAPVHVGVYDAQGRLIRTLVDRAFGPGMQTTRWDGRDTSGRDVPRGLYALRASTTGRVTTQKLVVLR